MPPTHNELPMVMETEAQTMFHIKVTFIPPPPPCLVLAPKWNISLVNMWALRWQTCPHCSGTQWSLVNTRLGKCCGFMRLYIAGCQQGERGKRFKESEKKLGKNKKIWWGFYFKLCIYNKATHLSLVAQYLSDGQCTHALTHLFNKSLPQLFTHS